VAALDLLVEIAREEPELARHAVMRAAHHAEGRELTEIEIDRVRTLLRMWPDERERRVALARLDASARPAAEEAAAGAAGRDDERVRALLRALPDAQDRRAALSRLEAARPAGGPDDEAVAHREHALTVMAGAAPPPLPASASARRRVAHLALRAIAAVREGDAAAARLLRELETAARAHGAADVPLWTAALAALGDASSRDAARSLAASLLALPGPGPRRGFLALATALDRAGDGDAAVRALRRAVARGEPGAAEVLADRLVRQGWDAHRRGDRDAALAALRAARSLWPAPGA
jgi:hypothetical protein